MNSQPTLPLPLRVACWIFSRFIYRIEVQGEKHLPRAGGILLVPNHLTYVDAVVLQLACRRPIRFLVHRSIYEIKWLKPIFRWIEAIPVSETHAKEAVRLAAEKLIAGEVVCIFPEGELSRSGTLLKLKKGFELIARRSGAPVLPVWLDRLWGSIFSFKGGLFFRKWPAQIPYPVTVAFDAPIPAEKAGVALVRERLQILGEAAYQAREELTGHLGFACLDGLRQKWGRSR